MVDGRRSGHASYSVNIYIYRSLLLLTDYVTTRVDGFVVGGVLLLLFFFCL